MSSSVIILIFSFWPFRHIANPVEFLEETLHTFHPSCKVSMVSHFKTVQWTLLKILTMDNGHMLHCNALCVIGCLLHCRYPQNPKDMNVMKIPPKPWRHKCTSILMKNSSLTRLESSSIVTVFVSAYTDFHD